MMSSTYIDTGQTALLTQAIAAPRAEWSSTTDANNGD